MGCGSSTAAAPRGATTGTQTDRSFVARQKDREAIEASSAAAKPPRHQLRPLGRGPDLNAVDAEARKTLRPANVLPGIKHPGTKDGTTQKAVSPLYHPPLPQIQRKAGGPSQEATATGSQHRASVANGAETLIVIPDETFDSSDDDLSSLDDNAQDETLGNSYVNATEKVGIASIVGTRQNVVEMGSQPTDRKDALNGKATGSKGNNGNKTANVSPTKMFSLGASDTIITSDQLTRNTTANRNTTATNSTSSESKDAAGVSTNKETQTAPTNASQQSNVPTATNVVTDRNDNAANNSPEENAPVHENNNNSAPPKGPVELLLQNENGDTLKKIHVRDNISVSVNVILEAVKPSNVLRNGQVDVASNPQGEQHGTVGENDISVAENVEKVVDNDQPGATARPTLERNIPVSESNDFEATSNADDAESVVSDKITNIATGENIKVGEQNAIDLKNLPEVIVTDEESDEQRVTNGITDVTLGSELSDESTVTGRQRRMLRLLQDHDLKKELDEQKRKRGLENARTEEQSGNLDENEQNLSNGTLEGKMPEPSNVTQRKKAAVLDQEDCSLFKHIEVHAVYLALELPQASDTFATLVKALLLDDLSDLEKVRMLFHWVTAQNLEQITSDDDVDEDSPLGYLKAVKDGKSTCAKLFQQLCSASGLQCHVIKGYKKGEDCLPDHNFCDHRKQHRGTWNAVLVGGEWRLIDCHWAARGIIPIEENGVDIHSVDDVYRYEEFYFLTDPEDLIDTHFPDCPEWQLLPKYLSITQFQSRVKRWPMFHQLGLQLKSHRAVVVSAAGDFVELSLGFSKEQRKEFTLSYQLKTKEGQNEVNGESLNRYVVQETWDSNENFTIDVPESGAYILDIYGHPSAEVFGNKAAKVCQYMIVYDTQTDNIAPFPEHPTTWGPAKELAGSGIFPMTHARAVVKSQGQVLLTFRTSRHLEFSHKLYIHKSDETGLKGFVVHCVSKHRVSFYVRTPAKGKYGLIIFTKDSEQSTFKQAYSYVVVCEKDQKDVTSFPVVQNSRFGAIEPHFTMLGLINDENSLYFRTSTNGEVEVHLENPYQRQILPSLSLKAETGIERFDQYILTQSVGAKSILLLHLPHVGEYALQLFAKDSNSQEQPQNVVNYCIRCDAAKEDCKPFPHPNDCSWGPVYPSFSDLGLALDVPQRPCIIGSSGSYNVSLAMTKPLLLRHRLHHYADDSRENMNDYTFCESTAHKATIKTCFPKAGDYCLEIYGTDFPPCHDDLPLVATFFIRCLKPLETVCQTFPQIIGRMWGPGCCLHEPLAGVLSRDREVTFKVDVPDVDDVVVKTPDSVSDMYKDQSGTWTCRYTPEKTDTSLLILGKFDKNANRYVGLLEFKIGD